MSGWLLAAQAEQAYSSRSRPSLDAESSSPRQVEAWMVVRRHGCEDTDMPASCVRRAAAVQLFRDYYAAYCCTVRD